MSNDGTLEEQWWLISYLSSNSKWFISPTGWTYDMNQLDCSLANCKVVSIMINWLRLVQYLSPCVWSNYCLSMCVVKLLSLHVRGQTIVSPCAWSNYCLWGHHWDSRTLHHNQLTMAFSHHNAWLSHVTIVWVSVAGENTELVSTLIFSIEFAMIQKLVS